MARLTPVPASANEARASFSDCRRRCRSGRSPSTRAEARSACTRLASTWLLGTDRRLVQQRGERELRRHLGSDQVLEPCPSACQEGLNRRAGRELGLLSEKTRTEQETFVAAGERRGAPAGGRLVG